MKQEQLRARFDDGTEVIVIKTTRQIPGYPHLDRVPGFALESGETLTPQGGDADLTHFITVHSRRNVTILR